MMLLFRRWWWRSLLKWEGELCQRCGRNYYRTIWWCDDERLWKRITWNRYKLLCPGCFSELAENENIWIRWKPVTE